MALPGLLAALCFGVACQRERADPSAAPPVPLLASAAEHSSQPTRPPASAEPEAKAEPDRRVRLSARHRLGVPLHERARDHGLLGRIPDGTEVTVLAELEDGWLQVALADGRTGFITRRYVAEEPAPRAADASLAAASGRDRACQAARARALAPAGAQAVGIATFNVRWFPDGQPGKKAPASGGTDLGFLACTIAGTGAEVVLVQEFKRGARAEASLRTLLRELSVLTHGTWQARFDECPIETGQHVGVLFDAKRAQPLSGPRTLAEWNPLGGACTGSLRPGLAQRFRLSSGQVADVVSVHLKSGDDARSYGLRRDSLIALAQLPASPGTLRIVGGDLNTMGCNDCAPPVSAQEERALFAQSGTRAGLLLVEPKGGCSHYYRGHAGLLDGFWLAPADTPGPALARGYPARVETAGACAELGCRSVRPSEEPPSKQSALQRVSDHCPLLLSLPGP